jgi:hypothetical protein
MANPTGILTDPKSMTVRIDTDLASKEYHFVNFDVTDDNVVNLAVDQSLPPYILLEGYDGSAGERVGSVALPGSITKLKLGEAVTSGKFLVPTASGTGEIADSAGERYGAIALENGASGDIIRVVVAIGEVEASDA